MAGSYKGRIFVAPSPRRGPTGVEVRSIEASSDLDMGDPGMEEVLPQSCIAHALSFTSPRDACRASAVSTTLLSAAASDAVWDRFLPADLQSVLARADRPVDCSSKRELFFRLCDQPVLVDGGKMVRGLPFAPPPRIFLGLTFSPVV